MLLSLFALFLLTSSPVLAVDPAKAPPPPAGEEEIMEAVKEAKEEWKSMSRKERKAKRKEIREEMREAIKEHKQSDNTDKLLLILITILIPPLGMFIYEDGITSRFWISLLLTLLFYVPGLIYTLIIILGEK